MIVYEIFSVYDSKAEAYMPPFYMQTKGQAIRAFKDSVDDPSHQFHKHAEDYTLFHLGSFSDDSASFDLFPSAVPLGRGNEFQQPSLPFPVVKEVAR